MRTEIISRSALGKSRWTLSLANVKRALSTGDYYLTDVELQVSYYKDSSHIPVKIEFWRKKARGKRFRKTL